MEIPAHQGAGAGDSFLCRKGAKRRGYFCRLSGRKEPDERALHTCNLRKSYGFHLVSQGGDPIPDADECRDMYRIALEKKGNLVRFLVEEVEVFSYVDDGETYGPCLAGGKIGFRQLAPMIAEYADLKVYAL